MKKVLSVFALCAMSAMAADFTGTIMDTKCSTKKAMRDNAACAARCIKGGDPAVLVTERRQDLQDRGPGQSGCSRRPQGDHHGHLDGDTIKVESVKM